MYILHIISSDNFSYKENICSNIKVGTFGLLIFHLSVRHFHNDDFLKSCYIDFYLLDFFSFYQVCMTCC